MLLLTEPHAHLRAHRLETGRRERRLARRRAALAVPTDQAAFSPAARRSAGL